MTPRRSTSSNWDPSIPKLDVGHRRGSTLFLLLSHLRRFLGTDPLDPTRRGSSRSEHEVGQCWDYYGEDHAHEDVGGIEREVLLIPRVDSDVAEVVRGHGYLIDR